VLVGAGYSFECDWWSVGVITFEMLCGYQPFAAPTPQETCDRILMWSHTLRFAPAVPLSPAAVDFVRALLCARETRLGAADGFEAVSWRVWFLGTNWPALGEQPAPYVPTLSGAADFSHYAEHCGQLEKLGLDSYGLDEPAAWSQRGGVHMMAWDYRVDSAEPAEGTQALGLSAPIEVPCSPIALSPRISPRPSLLGGRSAGSRRGSLGSPVSLANSVVGPDTSQ
jgi:serine/threonine protein kinase